MLTKKKHPLYFTIDKIQLEVRENNTPENQEYVPKSEPFIDNKQLLETIAYGLRENVPVLLIGDTGVGKTSAVRYLCTQTNSPFRRLNLNGQTTADEFVGKILVNEKGTYWTDGILIDAMRKGHILLLDEINAALPEVLFVLQSLLDDDRYIVLSDKHDHEIVRPHKDFRLIASMNPSDGYSGTKDLNKALMSRFAIVQEVKYPDAIKEVQIVKARFPNAVTEEAERMIEFGNQLRASHYANEMDFIFSTRELLNVFRLNAYFNDWVKTLEIGVLGKCNEDDRKAISGLMKVHFRGSATKGEDLEIGDEIITFKDMKVYQTSLTLKEKSTIRIINTSQVNGKKYISFDVISVPFQGHSADFTNKGTNWGTPVSELDNIFSYKRKSK